MFNVAATPLSELASGGAYSAERELSEPEAGQEAWHLIFLRKCGQGFAVFQLV